MIERIEADLKQAMLARDRLKTDVLKGIKNALKNEQIAKGRKLEEDEELAVLRREVKQREEAAKMYRQGGSTERAEQEEAEKAIIMDYLPQQLSADELNELVDQAIAEIGQDISNIGRIIGEVIQKAKGRVDGSTVSKAVKERLS